MLVTELYTTEIVIQALESRDSTVLVEIEKNYGGIQGKKAPCTDYDR